MTDVADGVGGGTGAAPGAAPEAAPGPTNEVGIDIVRVARIRAALQRFGARFARRVLTEDEQRYVRDRPETFAGRWAAKEAVSKVLGLGVRGVGWRDIEIVRLPTGQPAVRLSGRAHRRADQLGMSSIAVSISHEREYAVAVAYGTRTSGGAFVFPLDIEERLDERERRLVGRLARLRAAAEAAPSAPTSLAEADERLAEADERLAEADERQPGPTEQGRDGRGGGRA